MLNKGGIVAYPTETFYALGVRYDHIGALKRLFEIKGRSKGKSFPLIIGNESQLEMFVTHVSDTARKLMNRFWPGPLTILFPSKKTLSGFVSSQEGKVAVRVPGESFALSFAKEVGFPITATSANPTMLPPAEDARHVCTYFDERIDMIIDSGPTQGGLPSTIVEIANGDVKIVREGRINKSVLTRFAIDKQNRDTKGPHEHLRLFSTWAP